MEPNIIEINICNGACNCCIDKIYASMKAHPKEWEEMEKMIVADTPLHKAAEDGNTAMAVELLYLMPSLGRKLNHEGLSPLHLAIEGGHIDTVEMMAGLEASLVRVRGKNGETPLMRCAAKASTPEYKELLATLLLACPQSVKDVNRNCETVVHVALREKKCESVCILVNWLVRTDQISSVLNLRDFNGDFNGDTPLHAAARSDCVQAAYELVKHVKLYRQNQEGKTALDIAYENSKNSMEVWKGKTMVQVLKERKARRANEIIPVEKIRDYVLSKPSYTESLSRTYYYLTKQLTLEMRSAVLVVATVIFTATYQGVMQPPGGLYPAPERNATATATGRRMLADGEAESERHLAGQMVMQESYYSVFMPSNTFAFALSAVIIIFVTPGSPLFLILHSCLMFMCISYLLALKAVSFYTGISKMIFYMALYAVGGASITKFFYYPVKALLVEEDWWLRRLISVRFANWWSSTGWGLTGIRNRAEKMKKQNRLLAGSLV